MLQETAATLGYPTAQVTPEIADRATALSERLADTRAGLSRVLAEGRDETVRALAAREHATAVVSALARSQGVNKKAIFIAPF